MCLYHRSITLTPNCCNHKKHLLRCLSLPREYLCLPNCCNQKKLCSRCLSLPLGYLCSSNCCNHKKHIPRCLSPPLESRPPCIFSYPLSIHNILCLYHRSITLTPNYCNQKKHLLRCLSLPREYLRLSNYCIHKKLLLRYLSLLLEYLCLSNCYSTQRHILRCLSLLLVSRLLCIFSYPQSSRSIFCLYHRPTTLAPNYYKKHFSQCTSHLLVSLYSSNLSNLKKLIPRCLSHSLGYLCSSH